MTQKNKCEICDTQTDDIKIVWGHIICSCCIMLAVDCLKKEIENFEMLSQARFLNSN
jgi:hypothetical protein